MKHFLLYSLISIVLASISGPAAWADERSDLAVSRDAVGAGLNVPPDGSRVMIQKDVGGDRWAINWNLDDGSITGNVFSDNPFQPPIFLWCPLVSVGAQTVSWDCWASEPETLWVFIDRVTLPLSFVGR